MRLRPVSLLLLVGWAWRQASPGHSEEPLDALQRDTALVLRIASVDKITSGFKELVGALGPAVAQAGPRFETGLGELFQVGASAGVIDLKAPSFVAVFP